MVVFLVFFYIFNVAFFYLKVFLSNNHFFFLKGGCFSYPETIKNSLFKTIHSLSI